MKKTILVPTDFSDCASNAINFAVQSAKLFDATIIVMHAFETQGSVYSDYMGVNKQYNVMLWQERQARLNLIKSAIVETEGINILTKIYAANLREAFQIATAEANVDFIIMGTYGAAGVKEKMFGTHTSSAIEHLKIPIGVIPYDCQWKKPEKILVATNHFEQEGPILKTIFNLHELYRGTLGFIVFTDAATDSAGMYTRHNQEALAYERTLKTLSVDDITVEHLSGDGFESTLTAYIKKHDIDMLIMIHYLNRPSLWSHLLEHSQTRQMTFHSPVPLFVINAM